MATREFGFRGRKERDLPVCLLLLPHLSEAFASPPGEEPRPGGTKRPLALRAKSPLFRDFLATVWNARLASAVRATSGYFKMFCDPFIPISRRCVLPKPFVEVAWSANTGLRNALVCAATRELKHTHNMSQTGKTASLNRVMNVAWGPTFRDRRRVLPVLPVSSVW